MPAEQLGDGGVEMVRKNERGKLGGRLRRPHDMKDHTAVAGIVPMPMRAPSAGAKINLDVSSRR